MLKIKDSVDLKELEKFGFKKFDDKGGIGLFHTGCGVPIMYGEMTIHKSMPHWLLFNLIQAGLVEKVEALDWLRESTVSLNHNQAYDILQELVDRKTEKEFVLFNKQGERIDSVDPYRMHKVIGDKVIVSNDMFEYELSLENGNTFKIVGMED